ncbi:MAG: hypothetical protein WCI52_00080 [bacterium]
MIRKYIKEEIAYLKDNPEGYWFKRKLYGWGWTPATKQGWGVVLGYLIAVFALAYVAPVSKVLFGFVFPVLVLTVAFIFIAYKKGEKPRWQWGTKDKISE